MDRNVNHPANSAPKAPGISPREQERREQLTQELPDNDRHTVLGNWIVFKPKWGWSQFPPVVWTVAISADTVNAPANTVQVFDGRSRQLLGFSRTIYNWLRDNRQPSTMSEFSVHTDGTLSSRNGKWVSSTPPEKSAREFIEEAFYLDQAEDRGFCNQDNSVKFDQSPLILDPVILDVMPDGQVWDSTKHTRKYLLYSSSLHDWMKQNRRNDTNFEQGFYMTSTTTILSKDGGVVSSDRDKNERLLDQVKQETDQDLAKMFDKPPSFSERLQRSGARLLRASGWSDVERRAEFTFECTNHEYEFLTLVRDGHDSLHTNYVPMKKTDWIRSEWNVGIVCSLFRATKILGREVLAHWGVYIHKTVSDELEGSVPQNTYKVYGMNWTDNSPTTLHLEAVWPSISKRTVGSKWKRNLQKNEIQFIKPGSKYDGLVMYFSWPEFVLVAQYVLQEFIFEGLRIPQDQRSDARINGTHLGDTHKAYDLFNRNCQHFCNLLVKKMSDNRWDDPERQRQNFSLDELSKVWMEYDNPWMLKNLVEPVRSDRHENTENTGNLEREREYFGTTHFASIEVGGGLEREYNYYL